MNKVYLVTTQQGSWDDYFWGVHCICSTREKAEEQEKLLSKEEALNKFGHLSDRIFNKILNYDSKDK